MVVEILAAIAKSRLRPAAPEAKVMKLSVGGVAPEKSQYLAARTSLLRKA